MSTLSEAEFSEIVSHYGGPEKCRRVETCMGTAVFRKPSRAEIRVAVSKGFLDPKMRDNLDATYPLSLSCVVHPTREVFDSWVEEYPLIPIVCVNALLELAGLQMGEEAKK